MGIKNLTEAEEKEFYRLVGKMNGKEPDKKQDAKVKKPQYGDTVYYINYIGRIRKRTWINDEDDLDMWELGNIFFTEEEAEFAREKKKVEVELERYAKEHSKMNISFCMMNTMKNLIMMCGLITYHRERWYSHQNNLYLMQSNQ